ncbi:MAG: hypothetical protein ACLUIX_03595 [Oscillospiraceae bacterium]
MVRQRDALQQEVALCQSIATIRAFHDVTDEFYQRELQETLPRLETLDTQSLSMAIAASPYAAAVDKTFGPQLRRLLTLDQRLHTGGKELQARISRLTAQYQQLAASTKYQVQGETLSGGQLRFALTSTHRERRKAAYDAQQKTAVENGPVMEKLLRELVHARNQLARENGFDSLRLRRSQYAASGLWPGGVGRVLPSGAKVHHPPVSANAGAAAPAAGGGNAAAL